MSDSTATTALPQGRLVYTTKTLADAIGRSAQYVRTDIRNGNLTGRRATEKASWSFSAEEAERYARWIADGRPGSERGAA